VISLAGADAAAVKQWPMHADIPGDEARLLLRKRICLRLHPLILDGWEECTSRDELRKLVSREDADPEEVLEALNYYPEEFRPRALKESWNLFTAREEISIS